MLEFIVSIATAAGSWGAARVAYALSSLAAARRTALRPVKAIGREQRRSRWFLDGLRERVRRAGTRFHRRERIRRLGRTPVEALREAGAQNVRWAALREAGIESVGDLERTSVDDLTRLDGIGAKSAAAIREAVRTLRERVAQEPPRAPNSELDEPGAVSLARASLRFLAARRTLGDVPARLALESARLSPEAARVRRATGFWAWLKTLARPARREEALARAEELRGDAQRLLDEGLVHEYRAREEKARKAVRRRLSRNDVHTAYRKDFAACASAIEQAARSESAPLDAVTGTGLGGALTEAPVRLADEALHEIETTPLVPESMNIGLRRYQEFGTKFLLARGHTVLGDEMGLGKTIQALAAMAQLGASRQPSRFVVIAPASILLNWRHEIEEKSFLPVWLAHGERKSEVARAWLINGGVLVTSYATLRGFPLAEMLEAESTRIDFLVADEAHYVKNPKARRSVAVGQVVSRADRVCFMTGTPMENHPREFARLIEQLRSPQPLPLSETELEDAASGVVSRQFRESVVGIYLRRNQSDVLPELPEKIVIEEWVALSARERARYHSAVVDGQFMAMRQFVTLDLEGSLSAKSQRLHELLEEHESEGRKVLVFSYFLKVLEQLAQRHDVVGTIQGGVKPADRMEMIDVFSHAPGHQILLAQITAAGTGLNLQAASVIVLMEPQLTPGSEAQAIARAHRMGQTERVLVHRLLAADTVDERLVEVLREKDALFDDYARESLAKDRNPEATETHIVQRIIALEQERLDDLDPAGARPAAS